MQHLLILYDGECPVCNAAVYFIIRRDPKAQFRFASLQSKYGQSFLSEHPELRQVDSVILVEGSHHYLYATAVLRIAKRLTGAWRWLYCGIIVPRPLRDAFYRLFAKYRYVLQKKDSACRIPTPQERSRFLF